jgi:WD40 repeat protein
VTFSGDGRYLAVSTTSWDSLIPWAYVWDLTRPGQPWRRIELPSDTFFVRFSRDARLLYAAPGHSSDVTGTGLRVYDVRTGQLAERRPDGGEALTASSDRRTLAYGRGSEVVLSDATTGSIERRLRGAQGVVGSVAFSADGGFVAAVSDHPAAYVWEKDSGRLLETIVLEEPASDVAFDAHGDRLFVPSGGRLLRFDLTGGNRYVQRTAASDPDALPEGGGFRYASPYSPAVAISSYDAASGNSLLRIENRSTGRTVARLGISWEGNLYDSHAWSPDGNHLAYGAAGRLHLVDWRTAEQVASRAFRVRQLAYSPDGSRILAGGPSGLGLLDAHTLHPLTTPVRLADRLVVHADFGPGEDTAAVVTAQDTGAAVDFLNSADHWLVVDLETGETLLEGRLGTPAVSMAVSPDRRRMASASPGGMEIVDLRSGESTVSSDAGTTAELEGAMVAFSPDGELLASADGEGRVSLRDGTTAALLGTVDSGDAAAAPVFLDDQALLLPYPDGSTYVWDTSPQYAVDTACRIVGRGLTRDEWRAAFGDRPYEDVCG